MEPLKNIEASLRLVQSQIESSFEKYSQSNKVKNVDLPLLVAVSKLMPVHRISDVYKMGQLHFGENYIKELHNKALELESLAGIKWHFIGQIQTNKIFKLIKTKNLYMIQSIDSFETAMHVNNALLKHSFKNVNVLIQVIPLILLSNRNIIAFKPLFQLKIS
uniref:Pyridoxal phosphate homeostasis protein (Trinotate prediction) n=1 Tax=Myxobolus squamalis TaxID=59785 RepID=A0A6B2G3X3_MYXSQ